MVKKIKFGLKGATLLETLVALMLIVLSFSIGVRTFLHVTESNQGALVMQSYWYTEEYFYQWNLNRGRVPAEVVLQNGLTLKAITQYYEDEKELLYLRVEVVNSNDKTMYERNKIVRRYD
jgi:hypothetical protein